MRSLKELKQITSELNVLYVEDDEDLRNKTSDLLSNFFHTVDVASNGLEGLNLYSSKKYDIVFTDIEMPVMNGIEMIKEIRDINQDQEVIAVSAHSKSDIFMNVIRVGVQGFLLKPISMDEFIITVYPVCKDVYNDMLNRKLSLELEDKKIKLENNYKELSRYTNIIDSNVLTSSTDKSGVITYVSEAFCRASGYNKDELIGKKHSLFRDPSMSSDLYKDMWDKLKSEISWHGEIRNRKKNGNTYWADIKIEPLYKDNNLIGYTAIKFDITDKKIIEELSITDGLTKLYNRRHFNKILEDETSRAKRNDTYFSFIMMDVDHFKLYNDTYGHHEGDNVLIQISLALKKINSRASDSIFRLGGEELGIIFSGLNEKESLDHANSIKEMIESLKIEHYKNSASQFVTLSCGLVTQKGKEIVDDELIYKLADKALYLAKQNGRNQVHVYK